ncbi:MAG: hypothetical protein ACRBDX_00335 [Gammaproteobacteria bacterium]
MRYSSPTHPIKIFCTLLILLTTLLLSACATQYIADSDADQLVAAMQDLPEVKPYLANAHFYPEAKNSTGKVEADNVDDRNLSKIVISEDEMLNLAGHASLFRWFQNDGGHVDLPLLNVHARIYKLDHSIRIINGRMQPIAKTKIEIYLTNAKKERIYESVFTTEGEGQEGKILRNKRETQDLYGQAIYKAMVLAFESAFADIADELNLRPIDFDIDQVELKEELADAE